MSPCGLEGEEKARFPQGRDCSISLSYVILHPGINVRDINLKFSLSKMTQFEFPYILHFSNK
jgi:hypothetical protein